MNLDLKEFENGYAWINTRGRKASPVFTSYYEGFKWMAEQLKNKGIWDEVPVIRDRSADKIVDVY